MTPDPDPWTLLRESIAAEFRGVHQRLDRQFADMKDRNDERWGDTNRRIDDLTEALYGNGSPGLIKLVDRHDQQLRAFRTGDHKAASKHGGLSGGLAGLGAAIIIGVLTYFGVKPPQ